MVRNELLGYVSRRFGTRTPGAALTLRFVGLGQSQIDHTMKQHLVLPPDVTTSSQFDGLRVDFTFSLPEDSPKARKRLQTLKAQLLAVPELRQALYADDPAVTLEDHVLSLLERRGAKLAVVELASGGHLAAGLLGAQRAGNRLAGAVAADDEESLRRLLGLGADAGLAAPAGRRLELLGAAASKATGALWAVVVGPVVSPGQGQPAQVEVVLCGPDGNHALRLPVRGGPNWRSYLATEVLDQLRRWLRPEGKP